MDFFPPGFCIFATFSAPFLHLFTEFFSPSSRRAKALLELGRRQEAADALQQLDDSNEDHLETMNFLCIDL